MLTVIPNWPNNVQELSQDESLSVIELFQQNHEKVDVVLLKHNNQLNYFLNQNNSLNLNYWDALDYILGIQLKDGKPVAITDIGVPANSELVYSNYGVTIYVENIKVGYIQIVFNGLVSQVEWYLEDGHTQIDEYDSRGFKISEQLKNSADQLLSQKWFDEYGELKLIWAEEQLKPVAQKEGDFDQTSYQQLADLVAEVTKKHLQQNSNPVIAVATTTELSILQQLQTSIKLDYLVRTDQIIIQQLEPLWRGAQKLLVLSLEDQEQLVQQYDLSIQEKTKLVYPFVAQLKLGHSAEEKDHQLVWRVGQTSLNYFKTLVAWIKKHSDTTLTIVAASNEQITHLANQWVTELTNQYFFVEQLDQELLMKAIKKHQELQELINSMQLNFFNDESIEVSLINEFLKDLNRIDFLSKPSRNTLTALYQRARLVIDLNHSPKVEPQIEAISAGIPQIVFSDSPYVQHQQNGWIAKSPEQLISGLHYFLDGLGNWNEALVFNVALINRFSSDSLFEQWKEELGDGC